MQRDNTRGRVQPTKLVYAYRAEEVITWFFIKTDVSPLFSEEVAATMLLDEGPAQVKKKHFGPAQVKKLFDYIYEKAIGYG